MGFPTDHRHDTLNVRETTVKRFRSRVVRRVLVPVMAVSVLWACGTWKVERMAPAQVVTEKQPDRVRLTMLDSTRIELLDPQVVGSEIQGTWDRGQTYYGAGAPLRRIAIDSVAYASTPSSKWIVTLLVITGTIVFLGHAGAKAD